MSTISWYVSTPRFTIRVDVSPAGLILPTSARYMWRQVGQSWEAWISQLRRQYGAGLRVEQLPALKG